MAPFSFFLSRYIPILKSYLTLFGMSSVCVCTFLCVVSLCPCIILSKVENLARQLLALGNVDLPLTHRESTSGITRLALSISSVVKPPRKLHESLRTRFMFEIPGS